MKEVIRPIVHYVKRSGIGSCTHRIELRRLPPSSPPNQMRWNRTTNIMSRRQLLASQFLPARIQSSATAIRSDASALQSCLSDGTHSDQLSLPDHGWDRIRRCAHQINSAFRSLMPPKTQSEGMVARTDQLRPLTQVSGIQ